MYEHTDEAPAPDAFATLGDLNMMAEAIMEHVIERDCCQASRIRHLEATTASLARLLQESLSIRDGTRPLSTTNPDSPPRDLP